MQDILFMYAIAGLVSVGDGVLRGYPADDALVFSLFDFFLWPVKLFLMLRG